jgi:hypothetical protein
MKNRKERRKYFEKASAGVKPDKKIPVAFSCLAHQDTLNRLIVQLFSSGLFAVENRITAQAKIRSPMFAANWQKSRKFTVVFSRQTFETSLS